MQRAWVLVIGDRNVQRAWVLVIITTAETNIGGLKMSAIFL